MLRSALKKALAVAIYAWDEYESKQDQGALFVLVLMWLWLLLLILLVLLLLVIVVVVRSGGSNCVMCEWCVCVPENRIHFIYKCCVVGLWCG